MTLEGHIEDGHVVFDTPIVLPNGTRVSVSVAGNAIGLADDSPSRASDDDAASPTLAPEAWIHEFDAWVSGHSSRNPHFDDSRESIYPDRS
jgi:hypothetical protein